MTLKPGILPQTGPKYFHRLFLKPTLRIFLKFCTMLGHYEQIKVKTMNILRRLQAPNRAFYPKFGIKTHMYCSWKPLWGYFWNSAQSQDTKSKCDIFEYLEQNSYSPKMFLLPQFWTKSLYALLFNFLD